MIDLLHAGNSTTGRVWVSNPETRGTWTICSTCILTIALCVWQAVHLDLAPPHEGYWKQIWRRIGWSLLAWIAPELVAFNAWYVFQRLQYRTAKRLLSIVQKHQPPPKKFRPHRQFVSLLLSGSSTVKTTLDAPEPRDESPSQAEIDDDPVLLEPEKPPPAPWTMACAFYATSGGIVFTRDIRHCTNERTPICKALELICDLEPGNIPSLDHETITDKSKASGLSKALVCLQVSWFCGGCVTRLWQGLAISLLELNTLGHCVCALVIMGFWWHKPYGIETHEIIESKIIATLEKLTPLNRSHGNSDHRHWGDLAPSDLNLVPAVKIELKQESSPQPRDHIRVQHQQSIPGTGLILSAEPHKHGPWVLQLSPQRLEAWQTIWRYVQNPTWKAVVDSRPRIQPWHFAHQWVQHRSKTWRIDFGALKPYWRDWDFVVFAGSFMLACMLYGGVHLIAWNYSFATQAESRMWRVSGAYTVGSWAIHILVEQANVWLGQDARGREQRRAAGLPVLGIWQEHVDMAVFLLKGLHYTAMIVFRAYLVIESIITLPNSPPSVYQVPAWSTYVPHFS